MPASCSWRSVARLHVWLAGVCLCLLAAAARADDKDRWYILEMFGGKAGWMHTTQTTQGENIVTASRMEFDLKRGQATVGMSMETEFVETADGKPVSMRSLQNFGAMGLIQNYTFGPEEVTISSTQGGVDRTSKAKLPEGAWLTPAAAERYSLQRYKSGAKEIVVRTIDPASGLTIITAKRTGFEPTKIKALGREIDAVMTSVEVSLMPNLKTVEYIDDAGELIRSETNLGGLPVVMTVATKEDAMAKGKSPEIMVQTFVKPDRAIPTARASTTATYFLSASEGSLPAIPATGSQIAAPAEGGIRLTVNASESAPASEADAKDASYLAATAMCDAKDAKIVELAGRAIKGAAGDAASRAEAVRSFVHSYIRTKNMDVGLATASEVARNRTGDCTEHGVLTAALLRANGIPARVVAGLLYVDEFGGAHNIFGYHMWAQALVEVDGKPRWVDFDATLPGRRFDATHIALATSAMRDGESLGELSAIAGAMGRLQIKVEEIK